MRENYWGPRKPRHKPVPYVEGRKEVGPLEPLPEKKEVAQSW